MPKTVSATEMQNRFGSLADWAIECEDEVIVESRGVPKVVLISYQEYQKVRQWREQARRRELLGRLRKLRETVQAQNQDLTPEEAEALADRFSREVIEGMIDEGKIKYEGR